MTLWQTYAQVKDDVYNDAQKLASIWERMEQQLRDKGVVRIDREQRRAVGDRRVAEGFRGWELFAFGDDEVAV